jgi:hypothetical protein
MVQLAASGTNALLGWLFFWLGIFNLENYDFL